MTQQFHDHHSSGTTDSSAFHGNPVTAERLRAWTLQLYAEYDSVCYQYRVQLARPVIEIDHSSTHWGQWIPASRTLRLSSRLIAGHGWDAVVGILKHEMAHQFVTDVFKGDDAHGPLFKKACALLGVPEEFTGATVDLSSCALLHWKDKAEGGPEDHLLRKVEKLLAVATSSNEHESFLAMQRVQELFARHNIDRIRERRASEYVSLIINHKKKRIDKIQRLTASILNEHYFVNVIFSDLYDAHEMCSHKTMEILGARQNVLMAEYVYGFLQERAETLWRQYQAAQRAPAAHKGSYQSGLLNGFREKLEANTQADAAQAPFAGQAKGESTALVKLRDTRLEEFRRQRFPRIVTTRSASSYHTESYDQGRADGRKIVLSRGVESNGGNGGRLLRGGG